MSRRLDDIKMHNEQVNSKFHGNKDLGIEINERIVKSVKEK